MCANEFKMNYTNVSISKVSASECESERVDLRQSTIFAKRRRFE
jgi:hypothetical protein